MTDRYEHGYAADDDDTELPAGMGTLLNMRAPASVGRGGDAVEPETVIDLSGVQPAPQLSTVDSTAPTLAAAILRHAAAVEHLATAIEGRGRTR